MTERECSPANFLFSNVEAWQLYSPQRRDSKCVKVVWLVWTWIWAVALISFLGISMSQIEWNHDRVNVHIWWAYLTNWVFVTYGISMAIRTVVVTYCYFNPVDEVRWYLKLHWIMYNMAAAPSIVVAVFFWVFVYSVDSDLSVSGTVAHAVLAAHAVIDISTISAMPLRILHIYIPMLFGTAYGIFSAIYDLNGGTDPLGVPYIYKVLDWSESIGSATGYIAMAVGLVCICYIILFGLYKLRVFIYARCGVRTSKINGDEGEQAGISNSQLPLYGSTLE